jgi:hypothetical protein
MNAKVKVKLSLYRPWRPLVLREVEASTFSDIRLIDGGKVVSPRGRPLFYPQEDSWYSFLLEAESTPRAIVRLKGLGKLKKFTSSGTRPGDLPTCSIVPQPTTLPREWSASRPGRLNPGERAPGTHWIGGWVDPRADLRTSLDDLAKRKLLTLPGSELRPLSRPARSQSLYRLRYHGFSESEGDVPNSQWK